MAWFKDWFNSPYYHILYGKRNDAEASLFIRNIAGALKVSKGELALDLACGKGRHSKELASCQLDVYGVDLSEENIREAMLNAGPTLHFEVHDMRKVYRKNFFNYVFNIFTSFGYFSNTEDNVQTLMAVKENLKTGGIFVQDYFNARCVVNNLMPVEEKVINGIVFFIEKKISGSKIFKSIRFSADNEDFHFTEEVNLFTVDDFKKMYAESGLSITNIYGDYELSAFDPEKSNRIILISTPV